MRGRTSSDLSSSHKTKSNLCDISVRHEVTVHTEVVMLSCYFVLTWPAKWEAAILYFCTLSGWLCGILWCHYSSSFRLERFKFEWRVLKVSKSFKDVTRAAQVIICYLCGWNWLCSCKADQTAFTELGELNTTGKRACDIFPCRYWRVPHP